VLISLLALALVDSINPSAIAVTVYLLGQGRTAAHVVTYIVAIFGTYLALGATMMLGLDAELPSVRQSQVISGQKSTACMALTHRH
jgi:hypothetical protein